MTPPEPVSADLLLEHNAFLRGLARSLVLDEARADDVVQEAYMAALRKPPPSGVRLRAWMAAVTRNLALRSRRTDGRVKRREQNGGQRPAVSATDDVVARLEVQRRIAAAVSELEEPGRSAVVHRYFDGLKPAEIARREGVSVRTIESRLRRARERLRAKLDGSYGGSRGAWSFILAPHLGVALEVLQGTTAGAATGAASGSATAGATPVASSTAWGAAATGVSLMSTKMVLGVAAACAAGAFFAGWNMKPAPAADELTAEERPADESGTTPELSADTLQLQRAQNELQTERRLREAADTELARLRAKLTEPAAASTDAVAADTAAGADRKGARYTFHVAKQALAGVNWAEAGEAVNKMLPLLAQLKEEIAAGKPIPSNVGDIQRWNAPLVTLALSVQDKVTGTGINGAFTHPAIMVNLIHAALAQSKTPLSETQAQRLGQIGDTYVADEARRVASYSADVLTLEKIVDEAALKDRFYAEVDAILSPEQRDVLHPASLRGRIGLDIFSSGIIWQTLAKTITFSNRAELAEAMAQQLTSGGFPADQKDIVDAAALDWARGFSDEFLESTDDVVTHTSGEKVYGGMLAGWLKVSQVAVAAEQQLALMRVLLRHLPADGPRARKLRASSQLFIPLKKGK